MSMDKKHAIERSAHVLLDKRFIFMAFLMIFIATSPGFSDPPPDDIAGHVSDVHAVNFGLQVDLEWQEEGALPSTATLVLFTNGGVEVARSTVTPAAGSQSITIPGALHNFQGDGWFYHAILEDGTGGTLSALPFDVVLKCSDVSTCTLETRPGFSAEPNSPMVRGEMSDALDVAELSPAADLLDQVMEIDPSLIGDVLTFGIRLEDLVAAHPPEPEMDECLCYWMPTVFQRPPRRTRIRINDGPTRQRGNRGPGAAHRLDGRYDGTIFNATWTTNYEVEGETELRLRLRCNTVTGWRVEIVDINGVPTPVRVPIFGGRCPAPCTGTVENYAEFYATLFAEANPGLGNNTFALARTTGRYTVNGSVRFNRSEQVTQGGEGNNGLEIVASGDLSVFEPASSLLRSTGRAFARGSSNDDARAREANSYLMGMYGWAACASPQDSALWSYESYEGFTPGLRENLRIFFAQFGKAVNP